MVWVGSKGVPVERSCFPEWARDTISFAQSIDFRCFVQMKSDVPASTVLFLLDKVLSGRISNCRGQGSIRDTFLPKLISGEIGILEAERWQLSLFNLAS